LWGHQAYKLKTTNCETFNFFKLSAKKSNTEKGATQVSDGWCSRGLLSYNTTTFKNAAKRHGIKLEAAESLQIKFKQIILIVETWLHRVRNPSGSYGNA
jgi:hypothetical protein